MEHLVLDFTCRAALIAVSAAGILFVLRIRNAAAQHAVWTGVLVVMLALPLWMVWGPKAMLPVPPSVQVADVALPSPALRPTPAFTASTPLPPPAGPADVPRWNWRAAAIGAYLFGACVLLVRLGMGTFRARRVTGASCTAPITVGFFRPRILLPATSGAWSPAQLAAALTHEGAHARRRDPLVQWIALLNRALFWFHPLAWWLERRLAALAEDVCDAEVLAAGHDAADYSAFLLYLAGTIRRVGARVNATGVAMPGSGLPRRIRRILSGAAATRVAPVKLAAAALAFAISTATFAAGTLDRPTHIPRPPLLAWIPPAPLFAAQVAPRPAPQPAARPRFEVASIRPCKESDITSGGKKGGRGGGGRFRGSPGSLVAECQTVENLIRWAYLGYPDGQPWPIDKSSGLPLSPVPNPIFRQEIKGPGWIASDRYTIEAKAGSAVSMELMRGPMMQTLLEDRFHLKVRNEYRDVPVYVLTLGKSEPTLQPTKEGSCMSFAEFDERYGTEPRQPGQPMPRVCGPFRPTIFDRNPNIDRAVAERAIGVETYGQTIAGLCRQFSVGAERVVIDRTGLTGMYDIHLELAGQDLFPSGPRPDDPAEPPPGPEEKAAHIAEAVRKLGLNFEPGKSPARFVVIERVERPSEN